MHRIFTAGGFARVLKAGDSRRYRINLKVDRDKHIEEAITAAAGTITSFPGVFRTKIKERDCVSVKDYSHSLILRAISFYLTKRFHIHFRNRDSIVREVIETLGDSTPMYIIRRDISSFYESIPTDSIRTLLYRNVYIPAQVRHFIQIYFSTLCPLNKGVPRGLGISAIIAELAMRDIDNKIRDIDGVYKYFRYSDDILIFCYRDPIRVSKSIANAFAPIGLAFNKSKSEIVSVNCEDSEQKEMVGFEYLGYRFSFNNHIGDSKPRQIIVSIAEKKIKRLKSRIICSFKSYEKDLNFELLLDRLRFLSSNYFAYRSGVTTIKTSPYVRSGIYYNYTLCGTYKASAPKKHSCNELKALDAFFHDLLKGKNSTFSPLFSGPASAAKLAKLEKISFFSGYDKKMTVKISPDRVHLIKAAWRNG